MIKVKSKLDEILNSLNSILSKTNSDDDLFQEAKNILRRSESLQSERSLIQDVLNSKYEEEGEEWQSPWIKEIFDDHVVFEFDNSYYKAEYLIDKEAQDAIVGEIEEVEIAFVPVEEETEETEMQESAVEVTLSEEYVDLEEAVIRDDGTVPVKIIEPGWGTSGYYSSDVIERDGPKVFTEGTKMYWNHPTDREERERPEGDLDNLAGVLQSDAYYMEDGEEGPGLYADVKVFEHYQDYVEELAPYIGLSIRASGKAHMGEAEGQQGKIVDEITKKKSVDFVTEAGAGGEILQLFEAAIPRNINESKEDDEDMDLKEAKREIEDLKESNKELTEENSKLKERLLFREAKDFVTDELADVKLPKITKNRLAESLAQDPAVTEDNKLDKDEFKSEIKEAVKEEMEYISSLTESGKVKGMGGSFDDEQELEESAEELEEELSESLERLGISESR